MPPDTATHQEPPVIKLSRRYHPIAGRAVCLDPACPFDLAGPGLPKLAARHAAGTGHEVSVTTAATVIYGPQSQPAST
jgi:hypothetical protein